MSLIDEALKRARMEAAQRAAEDEGLPYPSIPRHLGPRRRRAWLAPAVVAVAVLAGLVAGWWIASRGPRAERSAARGGGEAVAQPVTSGPAAPAEVARDSPPAGPEGAEPVGSAAAAPAGLEEDGVPPPAPESAEAEPITSGPAGPAEPARDPVAAASPTPAPAGPPRSDGGEPRRPTTPPSTSPSLEREPAPAGIPADRSPGETPPDVSRSAEAPATRPAIEPPRQTAPSTEPAAPPTAVTDPDSGVLLVLPDRQRESAGRAPSETAAESHVQSFTSPQSGTIELGGIAWSETGPFALINGRVVGPGAVIQGYTLERIRPGYVELAGEGRRIQLSLQ